ncbi:MAG TPA: hypothetical protein DEF33_07810 [Clostridiales bacterium]|nr:hypothetical protein [Clostridiales bacterium]
MLSADTFRKTADFSVRLPDRSSDSNFESLLNIIEKTEQPAAVRQKTLTVCLLCEKTKPTDDY